MVEVVGRRPGFLLVPSPFPEHFCELVGFEARHLLQRNESSGWHNAEMIILGRSFALSPTVSGPPLASQDSGLRLTRVLSPRHWVARSNRDGNIHYVIQILRLAQVRPVHLFFSVS